ncbi:MAG: response regulator [Candidatus Omnitrophota bacterium]
MAGEKQTVLIVDDEIGFLKMLKELFEARGFNTVTAPTGTSALFSVENSGIDVVLLDIGLPEGSGLHVLKKIKEKSPSLPVVIYTARGHDDETVNKALKLGAHGYVSKNMPLRELMDVVDNALMTT